QSGRASALHRANGMLPASIVDDAAPAQLGACDVGAAVLCCAPFRLEPTIVPGRSMVFQSILLAAAVRIRCMVRTGRVGELMPLIRSRWLTVLGGGYLLFALVITMASRFPELRELLPVWVYDAFNPNDKTNLAPYRFLHFVVIAFLVVRFVPRNWLVLERPVFWPVIVSGQQSLEVFCVGIFLSSLAHFILVEVSNEIWMQVLVSLIG